MDFWAKLLGQTRLGFKSNLANNSRELPLYDGKKRGGKRF